MKTTLVRLNSYVLLTQLSASTEKSAAFENRETRSYGTIAVTA